MLKTIINKLISRFNNYLFNFSRISDEDLRRKAKIFNIITFSIFLLTLYSLATWIFGYCFIDRSSDRNFSHIIPILVLTLLPIILLKVSLLGKPRLAAWILISLLLLATLRTSLIYGVNVPMATVSYALIIFMSGILVGPLSAFLLTIIIFGCLLSIFFSHTWHFIEVYSDWKNKSSDISDILILNVIYLVIAIVSWLSSREVNKSLKNANLSEQKALMLADKLQKQNDDLEKIVEERTQELREHQLKQLMEINTLAEFGKISAGLLHDLKNPLTVISMNLDSINDYVKDKNILSQSEWKKLINNSLLASRTVESMVRTSQKQLINEDTKVLFDLKKEIKNTLILLNTRANKFGIEIKFVCKESINIFGCPTKLSRVLANLVVNSIDALRDAKRDFPKITIEVQKNKTSIEIMIKDNGCGIKDEDKKNIFQALFSTKKEMNNSGLGLFISKTILDSCFKGTISFKSTWGEGSEFLIDIPVLKQNGAKTKQSN